MFCTNCGMKNDDDASFCCRCGYPMEKSIQKNAYKNSNVYITPKKKKKQRNKRHLWIPVTFGLIVLVVAGIFSGIFLLKPFYMIKKEYRELLAEGDSLLDEQKPEEACEKYKAALELDPDNAEAYKSLSSAYVMSENIIAAHKVFNKAPVKVRENLQDTIEMIENQMKRTFLKTKFLDGDKTYYGVTNLLGDEIIPCIYDEVSWDEDCVLYGNMIFTVWKNGYVGYIDESRQPITDMEYTLIEQKDIDTRSMKFIYKGDDFQKDYAIVFKNGTYGVIDRNGNYFLDLQYTDIQYLGVINGFEYFSVSNDIGGVDIVKSTGEQTNYGERFSSAKQLSVIRETLVDRDKLFKYIDYSDGININYFVLETGSKDAVVLDKNLMEVPLDGDGSLVYVSEFSNYIICSFFNNGKYEDRIYDTDFHSILKDSFDDIQVDLWGYASENCFAARRGNMAYIYNQQGEEIERFQCEYDSFSFVDDEEGIFLITNSDKQYNFMNCKGELLCEDFFDAKITTLYNNIIDCNYCLVITSDGQHGVIDYITGEYVIPCMFEYIGLTASGVFYAYTSDDSNTILFDSNGERVAQGYYSFGDMDWEHFYYCQETSEGLLEMGLAASDGNVIIPAQYDNVSVVHFNPLDSSGLDVDRYLLEKDGQWGLAGSNGNTIIPVGTYDSQYCQYVNFDDNYLVQVQIQNQYGYMDESGEWVVCLDYTDLLK